MHAWEQLQKTIEYIEKHLGEEIEIANLAKLAALSPFYYQRLFRRLVKKPVAEYIKLRRMAKATEELLQKDNRILDVALELGFSSHEHFTRTFKDTFGMTPEEYRKNQQPVNRMTKPELMLHYTLIDEGVPLITDGIVLEINRRSIAEPAYYIGMKRDLPIGHIDGLGTESVVDPLGILWDDLHEHMHSVLGLPKDAEEIGVALPSSEEGFFSYFAGAMSKPRETPDCYTTWALPEGEYIVCSFEAEDFETLVMDALYKAQQYLYNTWLPNYNLATEPFCAERYPSHSPETTYMELWLKLAK